MLIDIQGVSKNFGGVAAVSGVSLQADAHGIVSLIGPNGAGKTTLFNLISGIYRPDAGKILFGGTPIQGRPQHAIARMGVSRTFQNIRLFRGLTVIENVMTALDALSGYPLPSAMLSLPGKRKAERENRRLAMEALETVGMEGFADQQPPELPYGLQRRAELARAIVSRPKLLMLDEPAAGLNPSEVVGFIRLIGQLRDRFGFGILIIEHRMQVVNELSDRVYVINFGRMLAQGTPREIRDDQDVIKAYLGEVEESA
ncbi:MAG TPA: ABC transporter ATP-binding protein [Candidatus Limnocylindria bacterium]|nr:ABC transporter ATP-binding protein [Candidatus Limnocylindria bacterium]